MKNEQIFRLHPSEFILPNRRTESTPTLGRAVTFIGCCHPLCSLAASEINLLEKSYCLGHKKI
jgi:hypothetical protein